MKKNIIIVFMLILTLTAFCELDYQLQTEFGFGGISALHYSNSKMLTQTAYGYEIFEIQENGNLENVSRVRDDFE
ncbi:hypothetical protein JEZ13_09555, partial [bacterium]|nr:hypothetical protein [bacterium]